MAHGQRWVRIRSLGGFVGAALRPARRFNGLAQEIGLPVAGLAVFYLLGQKVSWTTASFAILGAAVALLVWEGSRREYRRRRFLLRCEGVSTPHVGLANSDDFVQLAIAVQSAGARGTFKVRVNGAVDGWPDRHGNFPLPWAESNSQELTIEPGTTAHCDVGRLYLVPHDHRLSFFAPNESGGTWEHGIGTSMQFNRESRLRFKVLVIEVGGDYSEEFDTEIGYPERKHGEPHPMFPDIDCPAIAAD